MGVDGRLDAFCRCGISPFSDHHHVLGVTHSLADEPPEIVARLPFVDDADSGRGWYILQKLDVGHAGVFRVIHDLRLFQRVLLLP